MIVLFDVCDPDHPLGRALFADEKAATAHWKAVIAQYGEAPNIQLHRFENEKALIAYLDGDLREWNPVDLPVSDTPENDNPEPSESPARDPSTSDTP